MIRGAGVASGGWPLGAAFVSGLSPSEDTRQETLVLRGAIIASSRRDDKKEREKALNPGKTLAKSGLIWV